jgi:cysteinyl-tRNA synthetase
MQIHNSLTKKQEEIKSLHPGNLAIYSCGPTVYSRVHIGNLSSFIYADTLRRALAKSGLSVKHVMNFTDVDDKTIKAAQEKYPELEPKQALSKLTEEYSELFLQDMKLVGNDVSKYVFTKATDYIEEMKQLITKLVSTGFAYIADDGIYFSIEAYTKSGKIYGQLSDVSSDSTSEARINNDEYDKESVHDFALWKKQKDNEPSWDFIINDQDMHGRPGWHIECSSMSAHELGQPFDIHTGGIDLIFPHHENEIAQSTAGHNNPKLARYFLHNEHLLVDNQKMSKSLNNFISLEDITNKGFDPLAFRLLVLQSHYSSQAHFSWTNLEAAENRLWDLRAVAALRWQPRQVAHDAATFALEDVGSSLLYVLSSDLNTPEALANLSNVSTQLQAVHIEEDMVDHFEIMLRNIDDLFGLDLMEVEDINSEQKDLISQREQARSQQNWAEADEIRRVLEDQKIAVRDATHGPIWYRVK